MKASYLVLIFISIFSMTQASSLSSYIVTFPKTDNMATDQNSIIEDVKKYVVDIGGKITHEYSLIKGFTVDLPDSDQILDGLKERLSYIESEYGAKCNLEKDSEVHALNRDHLVA
ncbi:ASN_HP2_G0023790.mRNA.1.CDS.1 [Saccharomyces cerevisiae]|nr:BGN_3a_G0024510.mRNA.1.CDS.1 [Saccharomyces cerevisiae]CAI5263731.1 ASN_HP2_G0023790.mRNA.1.CDS.1 [Saccharomyces cerevisiae]CAI6473397.1 ASN_HP2_G0023790.mRNA.1.CDS.1 [Saccharomyces cerevisiae]CAI7154822.1 BGN_3a_G0024510.mRNA.1.CDS.1 [Saccharomyces cerevisiae]